MIISYYGEGCFKIQSGELNILTDPPNPSSGLPAPRFKADLIVKTLAQIPSANEPSNQQDNQLIYGPGEYNVKEIDLIGLGLAKESTNKFIKTIYILKAESLRICLLGHISELPEPLVAERLEEIDILFVPAGGKPFLDQKLAAKLIKQIEPKIIIPSFFKIPGLKRPAADIKEFLEEVNHGKSEPVEKLTIKKKDLVEIKKNKVVQLISH
ncbi:hypothetical protein A2999_01365 [Candidatus Wolfebacteria bacterium RIFCSPLOWO2_01_FULL_38_11]|uniref:Zn-dependent hydrolase of the beta-lactamase fold-like protein n=2 Tax=Candidatus Wolfeibacteriota TaxID=1752735 RepID=A0A0G0G6Y5_9BACT|nr:MAG: Zn-dependent hydrolase of the beta-lactamase fold-like protein [Candidatus Wolfebacteria bacterium GW2011_GWC1_37_10]OGM91801.1 MAG: hypothetical protein A2999_01365 [Candidatus Wolfebacteria bacterium RIFCSPLOWO2_01_FULL_38_11]